MRQIDTVRVWNRTDCCGERLSDFYVFVSDSPFESTDLAATQSQAGVTAYHTAGQGGTPTALPVSRTGRYVRVQLAGTNYLSLAEVEVTGAAAGADVRWLVADQLGTPRMVVDRTGSLAGVRRHDYLPFGEEIQASAWRTQERGYKDDTVRQRFTGYERDAETGLDYAQARSYSNTQGRFAGPDSFGGSTSNPQTLNLYAYVQNNPTNYSDPTGHMADPASLNPARCVFFGGCNQPMWRQNPTRPPDVKLPDGFEMREDGTLIRKDGDGVLQETVEIRESLESRPKRSWWRRAGGFLGRGIRGGVRGALDILIGEMIEPSQTAGGGDADLGPASMPWMTSAVRATFMGGNYTPHRLTRDTLFYRYFDEGYMIGNGVRRPLPHYDPAFWCRTARADGP